MCSLDYNLLLNIPRILLMYNLPNLLTILRVALIPVFVGLFYYPTTKTNFMAAVVFVIAALTDLLDGYLARKLKQTTKFGAFLDPVADKIMVCTALVLIVEYYSVHVNEFFPHMNLLVSIPAMVIIAREIVVSALREWMAEIGQRAQVAVNWVGKWKTAIQMAAIALLIYRHNEPMIYAAVGLLCVATVLTIWSMVVYLKVGLSHMSEEAPVKEPQVTATVVAKSSSQDAQVTVSAAADAAASADAVAADTADGKNDSLASSQQDAPSEPKADNVPKV